MIIIQVLVHSFYISSLTLIFCFKITSDCKFVLFFCPFLSCSSLMTTGPALLTHRTNAGRETFINVDSSLYRYLMNCSKTLSLMLRLMVMRCHNHQYFYQDTISKTSANKG